MGSEDFYKRVSGHRERLRQRFLKYGLSSFTDEEVLEMLLAFGTPRKDCKQPAREAIKQFGGLAQVMEAPWQELTKIKGIGPKNVLAIKFIHEVARRFLARRIQGRSYIASSKEVYEYLVHSMIDLKKEVFKVLYLDARNCILAVEDLFQGTIDESVVYPRELIERSLKHHASALVIAHNHPSGDPKPSQADIRLTKRLLLLTHLMKIRLLDHIIIGGNSYYSFADKGLLSDLYLEIQNICL